MLLTNLEKNKKNIYLRDVLTKNNHNCNVGYPNKWAIPTNGLSQQKWFIISHLSLQRFDENTHNCITFCKKQETHFSLRRFDEKSQLYHKDVFGRGMG